MLKRPNPRFGLSTGQQFWIEADPVMIFNDDIHMIVLMLNMDDRTMHAGVLGDVDEKFADRPEKHDTRALSSSCRPFCGIFTRTFSL